jgi:Spy/CpxP family protein refolding chaperone
MKKWLAPFGLVALLIAIPAFAQASLQGGIDGLYPGAQAGPFNFNSAAAYAFAQGKGGTLDVLSGNAKGTFWRNAEWAKTLGLTADQQEKMDDIFHQYRLKLVDLKAALEKEELILEPLIGQGRPEPESESKILTQIDRIAAARAELEKGNSKMMLSILQVLTPDQWTRLPGGKKQPLLWR